jgi:hypothetical protein
VSQWLSSLVICESPGDDPLELQQHSAEIKKKLRMDDRRRSIRSVKFPRLLRRHQR